MDNFVFENSTKVYFGNGCAKEYLEDLLTGYGNNVMLAYGGGSIKNNGIYDEIADILSKRRGEPYIVNEIMPEPTAE